jgi:hypothetical protein
MRSEQQARVPRPVLISRTRIILNRPRRAILPAIALQPDLMNPLQRAVPSSPRMIAESAVTYTSGYKSRKARRSPERWSGGRSLCYPQPPRIGPIEPAPQVGPWRREPREEPISRMLSAPSRPQSDHRRHKDSRRCEDRLKQVHGMTREQQEALIEEARAARLKEQRPARE